MQNNALKDFFNCSALHLRARNIKITTHFSLSFIGSLTLKDFFPTRPRIFARACFQTVRIRLKSTTDKRVSTFPSRLELPIGGSQFLSGWKSVQKSALQSEPF